MIYGVNSNVQKDMMIFISNGKIESIKNDLHKNGARFILLLLDTSSAYNNKNYDQVFPNDLLNKFMKILYKMTNLF